MIDPRPVRAGSIASRVLHAEHELLAAEKQLESLIAALYGTYSDYEYGHDGLDIYDAMDVPALAAALHRAGWRAVRVHGHSRDKFAKCCCVIRRDSLEAT